MMSILSERTKEKHADCFLQGQTARQDKKAVVSQHKLTRTHLRKNHWSVKYVVIVCCLFVALSLFTSSGDLEPALFEQCHLEPDTAAANQMTTSLGPPIQPLV